MSGESATGRPVGVVLLSGGMDSCVTAAIAARTDELALLHVGYGQRTEERERSAFHAIARHYGASRTLEARIESLKAIGGSALTDSARDAIDAHRTGSSIPDTYVPFRNTHLLALAASWGEVLGARRIWIGAVEEDSSGYPDCREIYYEAFNRLLRLGTRPETDLVVTTPLIHMRKAAIVREGIRLGAPLHLTWSCYTESEAACGRCESCRLRLRGFAEAGVPDPIPYRS
ncbi:MAG TPA: 7-cyano-7-deazaguanine synthase QueC [Candidatus Cryosericum sp.]|nr:7-cyano-7-deazaguanine synthase QueC [Candidatus Cryosericum sp.]